MLEIKDNLAIIVTPSFAEHKEKLERQLQLIRGTRKKYILNAEFIRFGNTESKVVLHDTVRGKNLFVVGDPNNITNKYQIGAKKSRYYSTDNNVTDIEDAVLAANSTDDITVVQTNLAYDRQDKKNCRESLSLAHKLRVLERLGVKQLFCFDAHNPAAAQNAVDRMRFESFYPTDYILKDLLTKENIDVDKLLIVAPDSGAIDKGRFYVSMLNCPNRPNLSFFEKVRDFSSLDPIARNEPVKESIYVGQNPKGLDCLIIDDKISSGGTIFESIDGLIERKCRRIYITTSFAEFTTGTKKFDEYYEREKLAKVYFTNMLTVPKKIIKKPWAEYVDCIPLLAELINAYDMNKSMDPYMKGTIETYQEIAKLKEESAKRLLLTKK